SGIKGVSWYKNRNRWVANIFISGKRLDLRFCKTFDEAVCYRLTAEQCVNWEGCDSNSPAYLYVKENIQ
ncbi:MAG: AP2/ERF family transcription factor, partial [Candidatus Tenebribacter davisii]|nr:AP2/ERF family transcription factor [Candidatus Tenebribacter davisii]